MRLKHKQFIFSRLLPRLIDKAHELGFEIVGGHWFRDREIAAKMAAAGVGVADSTHCYCLAVDLNLFRNGKWCKTVEDYRELGEWWETQGDLHDVNTCWGGRFQRGDGFHFSIEHNGVR